MSNFSSVPVTTAPLFFSFLSFTPFTGEEEFVHANFAFEFHEHSILG
jgi:hypothetical protein